MKGRKIISMVLSLVMLLSLAVVPASAVDAQGGKTFEDVQGHWGKDAVERWAGYGVIKGDETGAFNPDKQVTRAELATMLDNLMAYQSKAANKYTDLRNDAWYTDAVLAATAAGILQGDGETVRPEAPVSRQEAAVVMARVLALPVQADASVSYTDGSMIASWAQGAVNAMTGRGYLKGYEGAFRPTDSLTRAEMVTILDNVFKGYYAEAKEYTGDVDGSAVITKGGVTLKDMKVNGDLLVAEGVAGGHVELDGVTVTGKVIVRGGGENSIIIKGNSKVGEVILSRQDGKLRVSVEGNAEVEIIVVDDGSDAVKVEGTVDTLTIQGEGTQVEITGDVKNVNMTESAAGASLTVGKDAKVENLNNAAPDAAMSVSGKVEKVTVADTATDTALTVEKGATVAKVESAADGVSVDGKGKITNMTVTAGEGVTVSKDTAVTKVENKGESSVDVGGKDVVSGDSGKNSGSTSTGGGGSSGGGSTTSTLTGYYPATIHDTADNGYANTDVVKNYAVSATSTSNQDYIKIAITATDLRYHKNAPADDGFWAGAAIPVPANADPGNTKCSFANGNWDTTLEALGASAWDPISDQNGTVIAGNFLTFYGNLATSKPKDHIIIEWRNSEDTVLSTQKYLLDFSGTVLSAADKPSVEATTQAVAWKDTLSTAMGSDAGKVNLTWDTLITAVHYYNTAVEEVGKLTDGWMKTGLQAKVDTVKTAYAAITALDMSGKDTSQYTISTGALVPFTGLTSLNLSGVTSISDLGGLAPLTALEILNVSDTSVTELTGAFWKDGEPGVPRFSALKTLTAKNLALTSITGLVQVANYSGFNATGKSWDLGGSNHALNQGGTDLVEIVGHVAAIQKKLTTGFTPPTIDGKSFDIYACVEDAAALSAALTTEDLNPTYIIITKDITLATGINSTREGITLDGNGHKITFASDGFTCVESTRGIIFQGSDVTIQNLTIEAGGKATYALAIHNFFVTSAIPPSDRSTNITLDGVTINNAEKTALDVLHINGLTLNNVTTSAGRGMTLDDSANLSATGTTSLDKVTVHNKWGAVSGIDFTNAGVTAVTVEDYSQTKSAPGYDYGEDTLNKGDQSGWAIFSSIDSGPVLDDNTITIPTTLEPTVSPEATKAYTVVYSAPAQS